MPFTPFHMGPGLLLKSLAGQRFSLLMFGVSQVFIDLEPLIRILRGDAELHGFTHTLPGAITVGAAAAMLGRPPANGLLGLLRRETSDAWTLRWLGSSISWPTAFGSAFVGTGSHLVLDGVMHRDMRPFWPVVGPNPLLEVIGLGTLHLVCVFTGIAGLALLVARRAVAVNSGH